MIKMFIKGEWGGSLLLVTVLKISLTGFYVVALEKKIKSIFFLTLWLFNSRVSKIIGNCICKYQLVCIYFRINFPKVYFLLLL